MPLTAQNIPEVCQALAGQLGAIAESLNQCFETSRGLTLGTEVPCGTDAPAPELSQGGLLVSIGVEGSVMLIALPASLPLPDWHVSPNDRQESQLQILAMDWSFACIPEAMQADEFGNQRVDHLWDTVTRCQPLPGAVCLPAAASDSAESIWFIWPLAHQPHEIPPASQPPEVIATPQEPESPRITRLLKLPVTVIVQLARKRIELGSLRSIAPGSLVMFDKSCEELLDLYVNNRLFCRGEAVKVGEKFGLKINEVGPVEARVSAIIDRGTRT